MHVEEQIARVFLVYGPLGVIALVSLWVSLKMYRDLTKERADFLAKHEALTSQCRAEVQELARLHKEEMHALEERYITKAETWMQKYHDIAAELSAVADTLARKRGS